MNEQDNNFQKGFNNGYVLSLHRSDLFDKIFQLEMPDNPYLNGFLAGKQEYLKEMSKPQIPPKPKNLEKDRDYE